MSTTDSVGRRPAPPPGADLRHQVPTHLDVEDRPLYGLTVRQVLGIAAGGAWAYAVWSAGPPLPAPLRAALAAACVLVPAAVLAVRPAGRGLGSWALVALRHALGPRIAVWRPAPPPAAGTTAPPGGGARPTTAGPAGRSGPHRPEAAPGPDAAAWMAWAPVPAWGRPAPVPSATAPAPHTPPPRRAPAGAGAVDEEAA